MHKYFILLESCKLVMGDERCSIYDLQRGDLLLYPKWVGEFILKHQSKTSINSLRKIGQDEAQNYLGLVAHLQEKEFIHITDQPALYTHTLEPDFAPGASLYIKDAIVDFKDTTSLSLQIKGIKELLDLGCEYLVFRFFQLNDLARLKAVIDTVKHHPTTQIQILATGIKNSQFGATHEILMAYRNVHSCIIYTQEAKAENIESYDKIYTSNKLLSACSCGQIGPQNFRVNRPLFNLSQQANNCLAFKIGLDDQSNIKNCPSMQLPLGNLRTDSIASVIQQQDYQKYVSIKKDQLDSCKRCVFRYACVDCRAYLQDPADAYSKPLKCGYNPTTNKWEDWREAKEKMHAIEYYNFSRHAIPVA